MVLKYAWPKPSTIISVVSTDRFSNCHSIVGSFANKQIVRLQETPDAIPEGETPHTVSMCLYNTMVDAVKPGDRIEVVSSVRKRQLFPY